jgi:hypothetical protein
MGIVLKRRDNAPIVKEVCGGIIDILINKRDPVGAKVYLKKCLDDMFAGKYDIKYFLQSRTLKLKESYKDWTRIAHVYLAEKLAVIDPGNKPQSGDRIEFAVVKVHNDDPKKKLLQGELIETPARIKQNNLEIDYLFYMTNQIQNPATQFLELVDDHISEVFEEYKQKFGPKKVEKIKVEKPVVEKKPRAPRKKITKIEDTSVIDDTKTDAIDDTKTDAIDDTKVVKKKKEPKTTIVEEPKLEMPIKKKSKVKVDEIKVEEINEVKIIKKKKELNYPIIDEPVKKNQQLK